MLAKEVVVKQGLVVNLWACNTTCYYSLYMCVYYNTDGINTVCRTDIINTITKIIIHSGTTPEIHLEPLFKTF